MTFDPGKPYFTRQSVPLVLSDYCLVVFLSLASSAPPRRTSGISFERIKD